MILDLLLFNFFCKGKKMRERGTWIGRANQVVATTPVWATLNPEWVKLSSNELTRLVLLTPGNEPFSTNWRSWLPLPMRHNHNHDGRLKANTNWEKLNYRNIPSISRISSKKFLRAPVTILQHILWERSKLKCHYLYPKFSIQIRQKKCIHNTLNRLYFSALINNPSGVTVNEMEK